MSAPIKHRIPQIKVVLNEETMTRIATGPLKSTAGRGMASWVRQLINRELDSLESIESGNTQIDISKLRPEVAIKDIEAQA